MQQDAAQLLLFHIVMLLTKLDQASGREWSINDVLKPAYAQKHPQTACDVKVSLPRAQDTLASLWVLNFSEMEADVWQN